MSAPTRADDRFRTAHGTMLRGIRYLEGQFAGLPGDSDLAPTWPRARYIGNHLRELDAFLTVMLDAAVRDLGAGPCERRRFRNRRNTHGKLQSLLGLVPDRSTGDGPLCATGTLRECLNRQGGFVGDLDREVLGRDTREVGADMNDARIIVPPAALLAICGLYRAAGVQMTRAMDDVERRDVDFSRLRVHIACANVACDGS